MKRKLVAAAAILVLLAWPVYRHYSRRNQAVPPGQAAASVAPALTPEQRGRLVYVKYGCSMCHGKNAEQGIPNPNSQTKLIPALTYTREGYSLKELQVRIRMGAAVHPADPGQPPPPYRMPGWEGSMTDQELNDLCAYLFSLMPEKAKEEEW